MDNTERGGKGGLQYKLSLSRSSNKTNAAMKEMYSYLHPYLQRMEQPVRKEGTRNSVSQSWIFKRLHGEKI